jgi:hypothetical protein
MAPLAVTTAEKTTSRSLQSNTSRETLAGAPQFFELLYAIRMWVLRREPRVCHHCLTQRDAAVVRWDSAVDEDF